MQDLTQANPVYKGAIASQRCNYRFKVGTLGEKKPDEWIVVEGMHEPIISSEDFETVQSKVRSRQRPRGDGNFSLFAGLIRCGECGKALTIRKTNAKRPIDIYACVTYNRYGKGHCTQHRVEYDALYQQVLEKIRECAAAALGNGEAVMERLSTACQSEERQQSEAIARQVAKDEERASVLERMVMKLYEDMISGRITEQNFDLMMKRAQDEQEELKGRLDKNRRLMANKAEVQENSRRWVETIREYADIQELDAVTLHRLIREIVVHEAIDQDGTRHVDVEIHFNLKPMPEESGIA